MSYRLSLTIPSLSLGGSEFFICQLANHWNGLGHQVQLITLDDPSRDSYPLDQSVRRVGLSGMQSSRNLLQAGFNNILRTTRLRRELRADRPDCVVSFLESMNVLTLLAAKPLKVPVVISERTNPLSHRVRGVWSMLREKYYPRASRLVVQTGAVSELMQPVMRGQPVDVIPNGVREPELAADEKRENIVLAAGRLSREKRFDLAIKSFADATVQHPDWRLIIVGEGPQRDELEKLVDELDLRTRITLPGFQTDMSRWWSRASIFVMTSEYEGFPNALLEAMAAGCAVIASDCDFGPREIVQHESNGWLFPVGDRNSLTLRLRDAMQHPDVCQKMARSARRIVERYSMQACLDSWDSVIHRAMEHSHVR